LKRGVFVLFMEKKKKQNDKWGGMTEDNVKEVPQRSSCFYLAFSHRGLICLLVSVIQTLQKKLLCFSFPAHIIVHSQKFVRSWFPEDEFYWLWGPLFFLLQNH